MVRPGWLFLILSLFSIPVPSLGQEPTHPTNLLVDGSFEADGPPAWFAESWRRTFRDYTTQEGEAPAGKRSAVIRSEGPDDDAMLVQLVLVKPWTRYRFSGSVRTSKVVVVSPGGSTGANLSLPGRSERSESLVGDRGWTPLGFEFETGPEEQIQVAARLGHHSSTSTGTAWFDDLSLIELGPSSRPRVANAAPAPNQPFPIASVPIHRPPSEPESSAWLSLVALFLVGILVIELVGKRIGNPTPVAAVPPLILPFSVGLGLIMVGALLLPAAILGLLGIPLILIGPGVSWAGLIWVGRETSRPSMVARLLGGLTIGLGSYGLGVAAALTAILIEDRGGVAVDILGFLGLVGSWSAASAVILFGVWLRSRVAGPVYLGLIRAIGWTFAGSLLVDLLIGTGLPRSL